MQQRRMATVLAAGLALTTLVTACSDDDEPAASSSTTTTEAEVRTLGVGDDGQTITLAVDEELAIALEVNGGTGYSWKVLDQPDAAVVEIVDTSTELTTPTSAGDAPMTGRPETTRWRLRATGAGQTSIHLGLVPPGGSEPEDTVLVQLVVEP